MALPTYYLCSTSVTYFENDFGLLNQIILPLIFGALGCWIRLLVTTALPGNESNEKGNVFKRENSEERKKNKKEILIKYSWIFLFIGSLAGFIAVNLINPQGTFGQVSTLSFIAGLSGITFLLRSSLVDGVIEEKVLKSVKEETLTEIDGVVQEISSLDPDASPEELANAVKGFYNIDDSILEKNSLTDEDDIVEDLDEDNPDDIEADEQTSESAQGETLPDKKKGGKNG